MELRRVYYHIFEAMLFRSDDEAAYEQAKEALNRMIYGLGFGDIFRVLRPIIASWPYDLGSIQAVNEVRNQVAHGDITKVRYKGRSPFEDLDCLAQIYLDVFAIRQEMHRFFDMTVMRKRRELQRYVETYGDHLLI